MRILVTGAGGMLGQDVVSGAQATGAELVALTHAELDITDPAEVSDAIRSAAPDVVVNCAAWTDVDGAESALGSAIAVNGEGARNVASAAGSTGAWTIHVSSDYVFDGSKQTPYLESDATAPLSAYGKSKLAGERAVAQHAPEAHTIVRSSWLFGAHGHCFPATILRLAGERDELKVVADQVGCPTFTGHLAKALIALCKQRVPGILHVAGGGSCSWFEFAEQIVAEARAEVTVSPCTTAEMPRPAKRPAHSVLRSARGAPELPDWRQGLREYLSARVIG
jgi:dTDP-4-dehydrorhamnose reductase